LLLESRQANEDISHQLLLEKITPKQHLKIKGPVVDMDNRINEFFPSFDLFNKEFASVFRLIVIFPSYFSFHSTNRQSDKSIKTHICNLDNIAIRASTDPKYTLVVSDISIKNQVATSIVYVHAYNKLVIKTLYHAVNVTSTEAKLFAIRCSINQATNLSDIEKIIIIINAIHFAKKIFDLLSHPFQTHVVSISGKLRKFLCFFFIFLFYFFFLSLLCCLSLNVSSYKVATTVCP